MGTIRAEAKLCDGHMGDMKSRPGTIDAMCSVLQEMRTWQARGMECVRPMCTDFLEAQASAHPHPTGSHPPSGHFLWLSDQPPCWVTCSHFHTPPGLSVYPTAALGLGLLSQMRMSCRWLVPWGPGASSTCVVVPFRPGELLHPVASSYLSQGKKAAYPNPLPSWWLWTFLKSHFRDFGEL